MAVATLPHSCPPENCHLCPKNKILYTFFHTIAQLIAALTHLSNSLTFLGDGYHEYVEYGEYFQFSYLWMIKRQHWIRGPDLPSKFYLKDT